MKPSIHLMLLACLALAACDQPTPATTPSKAPPPTTPPAPAAPVVYPPVEPPAPGQPGGLPDDRTPLAEGPIAPESGQDAAQVVQTYFALIGEKKYADAYRLWFDGGKASQMTEAQFAASFGAYIQFEAQVGAPGDVEGAAGSSYVEVPVVVYGRLKNGQAVHLSGPFTLRRSNNVPGSSAEDRTWRIYTTMLEGPEDRD